MGESEERTVIKLLDRLNLLYRQFETLDINIHNYDPSMPSHHLRSGVRQLAERIKNNIHAMHDCVLRLRLAKLESWVLPVNVEDFEKLDSYLDSSDTNK